MGRQAGDHGRGGLVARLQLHHDALHAEGGDGRHARARQAQFRRAGGFLHLHEGRRDRHPGHERDAAVRSAELHGTAVALRWRPEGVHDRRQQGRGVPGRLRPHADRRSPLNTDATSPDANTPWPAAAVGWTAVALLALASIVSQWDRTVINLMVGPIKETFALDDTAFGALQSVAFGIFYVIACVPIGRLADRHQRRVIIAVALGFWSLFAMSSGLARNYTQLFLTRIGVAVGEASLTPAGFSMLSDLFPPAKLGRPVGAFLMSSPVGQGLAFIGGGALLQWLTTSNAIASSPLAGLAPWQVAFILVGAPGLLLVPLFLLYREPLRRGRSGAAPLPASEVWAVVRARSNILVPMFAAFAMVPLVSYAFNIWTPALFQRTWG
ncbi:MFS transporter, partial [bacterium]